MVESNFQRPEILPSEKAYAYKMCLKAMKKMPGRPGKDNLRPVGTDLSAGRYERFDQKPAETVEDSARQIYRYIRLTNLVPELLEYMEPGKMKMRPAVEPSYLDEETQRDVVDRIDETEAFPSHDQTIRIRKAFGAGDVDYEKVTDIMAEDETIQKPKIKFSWEKL